MIPVQATACTENQCLPYPPEWGFRAGTEMSANRLNADIPKWVTPGAMMDRVESLTQADDDLDTLVDTGQLTIRDIISCSGELTSSDIRF